MKKFLKKILICVIPIFILISMVIVPPIISGELISKEEIAEKFINGEAAIVYPILKDNSIFNYLRGIQYENENYPDVVAYGTSRNMQYSNYIFDSKSEFTNLSVTTNGTNIIESLENALKSLNEIDKPEVFIVNFDQWYFREEYELIEWDNGIFEYNQDGNLSSYVNAYLDRFFSGNINIVDITSNYSKEKIGLLTLTDNSGMTVDGPTYYGDNVKLFYNNYDEYQKRDINGDEVYQFYSSESLQVNQEIVDAIESFLEYAKSQDVHIIAILPPYYYEIEQAMNDKDSGFYYMSNIYPTLKPLFDNYGFELYDFTIVEETLISKDEYIDFTHVTEIATAKLILEILEEDSVLNEYITQSVLQEKIDNAYSLIEFEPLIFYKENEVK